jgi:hypothetical protein
MGERPSRWVVSQFAVAPTFRSAIWGCTGLNRLCENSHCVSFRGAEGDEESRK